MDSTRLVKEKNEILDSLDIDKNSFNTDNYPDSAKDILYKSNDTLWNYVFESLLPDPKIKAFPNQIFYDNLVGNNFNIDTTDEYFFSEKRLFNKRLNIQFNLNKPDTIIVYTQIWYNGKKYSLVTSKWDNAFRTKENYR